jgi:hypothetical protein
MDVLLSMLVCSVLLLASGPHKISNQKQVFVDDQLIETRVHVALRANPGQKLGPIVKDNGKPLEGFVSRVLEDNGKIRLYLGHENVQVLESNDALHFQSTGTTISSGTFPTIFVDPHERDPARKYKLFYLDFALPFDPSKHGVYASYSSDGVHFTKVGRVLPFFTDNPALVCWDERIGKYVIYTRAFCYDSENQRRIGRIETDDPLRPWPYTKTAHDRMFFGVDNVPVVLSADAEDDAHSDIYYNAITMYQWAQDTYCMFTSRFRHFSPTRNPYIRPRVAGQWEDFGMLEVQLAVSRDGIHWSRPTHDPYFPMGLADEWDRWYSVMAPGIIRRGNYLYQYYNSTGRLHDSVILRPEYDEPAKQVGGVGVVRQRLDGFVSADADQDGGSLQTKVLRFDGKRLRLNIDTGAMGTAYVELQDEDGKPIPGFSRSECEQIVGNFIDQQVYWNGNPDVSAQSGKAIRIYFQLTRAKLYGFQFLDK